MWTALEGVMVGSRYEMQSHLATGGMAAVFRGWDHRLRRPVAIKVLHQLEDANPHAVERFRREARATAALRNPHIVEVYDFFEEHNCYYLVMELVEGVNLKEHLAAHGPLPPETTLTIAAQVCDALAAAHDAGFIHRDIKPQNILLSSNGPVKLTDFGIVYIPRAQAFTTGGMVLGTADYISPEQAQALELGPTTDIYSLGVVLYEMLTGALPFTGTTPIAVAMRHATAPVPSLRQANPTVPQVVEQIVLRALCKEPAERYHSARAMADALRGACRQLIALCETDTSSALPADVPALAGGSAEWRALAQRLSQPLPQAYRLAGGEADPMDDITDAMPRAALAPHAPVADHGDGLGEDADGHDEGESSDFAEHFDPVGFAVALSNAGIRRLMAVAGAGALLLVGIVVLHLLR